MAMSDRYDEYFRRKSAKDALAKEQASGGVQDLSGPIGEGVAETNWLGQSNLTQNEPEMEEAPAASTGMGAAQGAAQATQQMAAGGDKAQAIGSGLTSMGAATANPYMVGAGLALSTASSIKGGQNQRAQQGYQAEVAKINARQNAINRLAEMGSRMKA